MTIGQRIRELRAENGLTQKSLAVQTGIPIRTLINYENSNREPNAKNMAILERFFKVSGDYLRGESNERMRAEYTWNDAEIMETVWGILPSLLHNLNSAAGSCSDQEQKLCFDILVELLHILKLENQEKRISAVSMLQDTFSISTRFIDICIGAGVGIGAAARIEKAKAAALFEFEQSLNTVINNVIS